MQVYQPPKGVVKVDFDDDDDDKLHEKVRIFSIAVNRARQRAN